MLQDIRHSSPLAVTIGQCSAAGPKPENQDFHGALVPGGTVLALKGIAVAIADGIGSSRHGREAAETAVGAMMTDYFATPDAWTAEHSARKVIAATNSWLWSRNRGLADIDHGHVATLSALILKGREAHVLHVGDCRIARVAGLSLEPLTRDHHAPEAETRQLSRALGAAETVEIDHCRLAIAPGDIFVLTSDGVHEALKPREIARLAAFLDPQPAAEQILRAALAAGGTDNATVQVVRIDRLPEAPAALVPELADLPVPALPAPGTKLDGYRIIRQIHASARSHVFLAEAPDGTRVALKIPSRELAADPVLLGRFVMEEWIARRVSSPHVVRAAPVPGLRSALYVVTELVEGTTLRQWMTDNPRPGLAEARGIAGQIALGLRALHRRQMIHQDLRPENVMIDPDGTAKIIDLGSVTVAGVEEAAPGLLGEMPGTFQYTAPEYLSGDAVSWRSDQFALAVILYEMLTGRLPYGAQVARVRSRTDQRRLAYRPARDDESSVPDWMDAALARACHPDPLRRYDALGEFTADLARPAPGWRAKHAKPLIERNPVRFWQAVSAMLALACLVLAVTRGG
ncbi:bifunctional protein-serine/threonine kinase/phosphatase [Poseidonocella sp. HB161398]|uniref:bifunctional protein-serine/threonine kinase/phosphatase n=1 Tax=Poseidonocella sp. HB161398 TaxID=2320855 RepID=UPI001108A30D|nr:bifunctional protein-serine/threonine kinase/phosphatase [Poseidonocella sp. HB161398]